VHYNEDALLLNMSDTINMAFKEFQDLTHMN